MKVLIIAAVALSAISAAERHAWHRSLETRHPWFMASVAADGHTDKEGAWITREECEAQIKASEERNHTYGSYCFKDPKATTIRIED